jgi:hypothetical protein
MTLQGFEITAEPGLALPEAGAFGAEDGQPPGYAWCDRRRTSRYLAGPHPIVLVWTQHGWMRKAIGTIIDVGLGGALLQADRIPPAGQPTWLHLKATGPRDWIEVTLLEARSVTERRNRLRVAFSGGCPLTVFQTLVWGPHVLDAAYGGDTFA